VIDELLATQTKHPQMRLSNSQRGYVKWCLMSPINMTPDVKAAQSRLNAALEAEPVDLAAVRRAASAVRAAHVAAKWPEWQSKGHAMVFVMQAECSTRVQQARDGGHTLGEQMRAAIAEGFGFDLKFDGPDDGTAR
jgi:hypothetical protein